MISEPGQNGSTGREGPFPGPRPHERPWETEETAAGPFDRRRADRRASSTPEDTNASPDEDRRRRWGRRKSDVLSTGTGTLTEESRKLARRFREPLIGLTLAGVAAPIINAGVNPETAQPSGRDVAGTAEASESAVATRDLEEGVGEYWADSEASSVRAQTIEGAMTRWQIDRQLAEKIYEYATKHDIEPDMAYGLVFTESTFRERAVSHVGARGLTQLMPRTAQWLDPSVSTTELFDPDVNLDLGFRYLRQLIDKYEGDVNNALTAYNRGPGTVDRILERGGNPDNGYAGKVQAG